MNLSELKATELIVTFARLVLSMCADDAAQQAVANRCGAQLNHLSLEASRRRLLKARTSTPLPNAASIALDAAMADSHQPNWMLEAAEGDDYKTPVATKPPNPIRVDEVGDGLVSHEPVKRDPFDPR